MALFIDGSGVTRLMAIPERTPTYRFAVFDGLPVGAGDVDISKHVYRTVNFQWVGGKGEEAMYASDEPCFKPA